ncbi:DUF1735 domain-containing protein [Pedobacter polaris]|uniref:DUF1735 domain-containing protein n=1 Tax=Pedobacter polaris TaxID=2571273 RepID=A0A4V5P075_9SPHI|nr:DUF1735 domain-containing protein [Pedobacter polaris]TKC12422.1 DUF1735 domain-containing protein [Pedobacter polaris]
MKKIFNRTLAMLVAVTALTSCLKDDSTVLDPDKSVGNVIEFANPKDISVHGSTTAAYIFSYDNVPTPTNQTISVSYSGPEAVAPKDIEVEIGLGPQSVITQYNTEQNGSMIMMPSDKYVINATKVVIPKGKRTASFTISFKTSTFVVGDLYALPLQIKSASHGIISGNFSNIILNVIPKNLWDGIYSVEAGTITRYTNPTTPANDALSGSMAGNPDVTLQTKTANSVTVVGLNWANKGGGVGGVDPITMTINANNTLSFSSGVTTTLLKETTGRTNTYDPATKTFTINFDWNPAGAKREVVGLVLKYKASRP